MPHMYVGPTIVNVGIYVKQCDTTEEKQGTAIPEVVYYNSFID